MSADLDVDRAREFGVAVPPTSADEYAEKSAQLQPGYTATADANDPSVGWTSQHRDAGRDGVFSNFVDPASTLPGQVYTPGQLPDPDLAIAAGMAPVKIPAHLITDDPNHIQGPEPTDSILDRIRADLRGAVVKFTSEAKDTGEFTPSDDAPVTETAPAAKPAVTPSVVSSTLPAAPSAP